MEMREKCLGLDIKDIYVNGQLWGQACLRAARKEKTQEGNVVIDPMQVEL